MELIFIKVVYGYLNKKYLLFGIPIIILLLFTLFFQKQTSAEMDVVNSQISTSINYCSLNINVIANQIYINDYEQLAYDIIEHCKKNDFHSVRFSYDIKGYPHVLSGTVCLNERTYRNAQPCFSFTYQSANNAHTILDNSNNFELTLTTNSSP